MKTPMQTTIKDMLKERGWLFGRPDSWVKVENELITSEAFSHLSATAIRVYFRFIQKRPYKKVKDGKKKPRIIHYNEPIVFTYAEAACFGIPRSSFARALRELVKLGFIEVIHQGGTVGNGKDWSSYRLIDDWRLYGASNFIPREKKKAVSYSKSLRKFNEAKRKKKDEGKSFASAGNGTRTSAGNSTVEAKS